MNNCPQNTPKPDGNIADNTADDTTPMLTAPAPLPPMETPTTSPDAELPPIIADQTHEISNSPAQADKTPGHKRQLTTDSDSDNSVKPQQRQPRLHLQAARSPKNTMDTAKDSKKSLLKNKHWYA